MKRIGIILGVTALIFGSTSCKKCYECTALDDDNVAVYNYPEICGGKKDFEHYQARCESEFGDFEFNCSCGEVK